MKNSYLQQFIFLTQHTSIMPNVFRIQTNDRKEYREFQKKNGLGLVISLHSTQTAMGNICEEIRSRILGK
jgi:hypothetical protein